MGRREGQSWFGKIKSFFQSFGLDRIKPWSSLRVISGTGLRGPIPRPGLHKKSDGGWKKCNECINVHKIPRVLSSSLWCHSLFWVLKLNYPACHGVLIPSEKIVKQNRNQLEQLQHNKVTCHLSTGKESNSAQSWDNIGKMPSIIKILK